MDFDHFVFCFQPIFRSLSVDSSHSNKSQSCTAVNRRLTTTASTISKQRTHVSRTRSLPPLQNNFASPNRWFSSKKFEEPKTDDPQYVTEYREERPSTSGRSSAPAEQYDEVVLEDRVSLPELQPSNAKPVADNCIRNDFTFLTKATRKRLDKIVELKRSAQAQYEKAVKAFVGHEEEECSRYQLEAARRKVDQSNEFYRKFKKQYESEVEKAHQLQPKNIKPYGKLNTIPWTGPNSEYRKLSIVDQNRRRSRYETIFEKRRCTAATENKSPAEPSGQQREYCTTNVSNHVNSSPDLEKCKAIIAEYKKLNPDYTGKANKVIPGSDEEKLLLEKTQELITKIKSAEHNNELGNIAGLPEQGNNKVVSSTTTTHHRSEPEKKSQDCVGNRSKLGTSQPSNQKVVLYYQNKYRNKVLSSKVLQADPSVGTPIEAIPNNTTAEIKVMIGPKLMLQSFDLNDRKYNTQDLIPAPNVKFVAPWLSWSDRVKQHIQKKSEDIPLVRSNGVSDRTTQKDNVRIATEIQKRQLSQVSNIGRFINAFNFPEPQLFNDSTSIFVKNMEKNPSFSTSLGRLFSTNSTRGVLGPEGTVMVKLRRLPKINIPEPIKDCSAEMPEPCEMSDGVIEIKQKKLPKLPMPKCAVQSVKDVVPALIKLERPKSRSIPPEPPRICSSKLTEREPRADDGMVINQKKLPKIQVYDCPTTEERPMTSPPLPRLKARPVPPPTRCADIKETICVPRADEGLRVTKKILPNIRLSDCCPDCPPPMTAGQPLKRLKKLHIPEPEKLCLNLEDVCPPRADDVLGYKVKRKKLQTLLLGERYNNLSWKEFNAAKQNNQISRNYTTDSKSSMCCYSDKSVHPNFTTDDNVTNEWDKIKGQLFCEENGKLTTYFLPEEKIDDSMGSELKIIKKPIGGPYMKDNHIHEKLLKGGFTTFINKSDRKLSSYKNPCSEEPDGPQYTDWNVKPLKKRINFNKDFPSRARFEKDAKLPKYRSPCEDYGLRMDDVLRYEVKPKRLPVIPKGKCERVKKPTYKPLRRLPRGPKRKYLDTSYDCPKGECIDPCPPRADEGLIEKYNKLVPMSKMSNCPKPVRKRIGENDHTKIRRLPPPPFEDRPPCTDCDFCEEYLLKLKEEEEMELKRREHGVDPGPKVLPRLVASKCVPKRPSKPKSVRFRRLPKPPFMEREDKIVETADCNPMTDRADGILNYQKKPKKLKSILKANNKAFSTLPTNFLYKKNFSQISFRCISKTTFLHQTSDEKCKKIGKTTVKKCLKISGPNSKCKAKSISCHRNQRKTESCTKQKSPYPSFSECKEHYRPETITECMESDRHLQPRWPILGEIINQKPPPPHQGKIDPAKQEECIARKFNMRIEGHTKTCETMGEADKPLLTNEMYKEVINNPPFDKCECANEKAEKPRAKEQPKGDCPPVEHPICPDPEIECELPQARAENMACGSESKSPKGKTTEKPKLICKKKGDKKVDEENKKVLDECDELEKKYASSEKTCNASTAKLPEKKVEKTQQSQDRIKECKPKEDDCLARKQQCEDEKAKKKKKKSGSKCDTGKKKGKKTEKKSHCRNVKVCSKGKAKKDGKKSVKETCKQIGKKGGKKSGKKGKPKKCSDLLKEEDAKEAKKKGKGKKSPPKPQMADLCKQKKPCTPKAPPRPTSHSAVLAAKCPPKKSFWQRILDFFRARPNCPPPDQWKKDKLRKKAEKAAAAAGLELCEKKKPQVVKVTCKKTGVRDSNLHKSAKRGAVKDKCKKIKVSCGTQKKTAKKRAEKQSMKKSECKEIKSECKESSPKSSKKKSKKAKSICDEPTVAEVVRAKECDPEAQKECVDDGGKQPTSSGKCKVLRKQEFCKPRARLSCKIPMVTKECTPVEPPYPSFSDVKKDFPRLPASECTEQEKNVKRKTIKYDYNEPGKQNRNYSTSTRQKRFYSSNSNGDKKFDPLALLGMSEESLNEIEDNELALRILEIVKEGMKTTAIQNSNITKQKYYDIFKELEFLCEQELSRSISDNSIYELNSTKSKVCNLLPDANLSCTRSLVNQKRITNIDETMMKDAIRNLCQTIVSMPNLSTMEYEDTGKQ